MFPTMLEEAFAIYRTNEFVVCVYLRRVLVNIKIRNRDDDGAFASSIAGCISNLEVLKPQSRPRPLPLLRSCDKLHAVRWKAHNSYSRAVECKKRAAIQSVNCVGYFVMVGTNHRGRAEKTPDWRAGTFSNQAYAFESHSLGAIRH